MHPNKQLGIRLIRIGDSKADTRISNSSSRSMYLGRRKRREKKISPRWPSMLRSSKLPIYTRPRSTTIKGFSPVCPPEVGPRSRPRVHRVCIHAPRSRSMIVNCAFDHNHHRPSFLVPRPYVFFFFFLSFAMKSPQVNSSSFHFHIYGMLQRFSYLSYRKI